MGKSSRVLDEIDVMAMISALGTVHSGRVEVRLSPAGLGFTPSVLVSCLATFDVVPGSSLPEEVRVEMAYPCKDHRSLYAHIYDGLYRLDSAIQTAYEHAGLPEA
jgi:hypothetical protein